MITLKKIFFIITLALCAGFVRAEEQTEKTKINPDFRFSLRAGSIMPDGKVYKSAGESEDGWVGPVLGGEIAVSFRPSWRALREWNDASVGVALSYWNMVYPRLGQAVAPYVFMDVPLVRVPHFVLGIRPGFGASFLTRTYRNTIPEGHMFKDLTDANQSIGSVFNFYFPEALYMDFPLRDGWSLTAGVGWYHMSNGSLRQPNSGYNIISAELGARYTPPANDAPAPVWTKNEDSRPKKWELELGWTGGCRQVYYRDQQTFFCSEIQLSAYWRAHNIFRLGGGLDVFYDGAYIPRETKFGKTDLSLANPNGSDCWRVGVSLQPEFVIGAFTAGFHVGAYLLDPVKKMEGRKPSDYFYGYDILNAGSAGHEDGWIYTQVVLKYHLPWHLFIQGTMKAHLTKVEFVSIGIGAWI